MTTLWIVLALVGWISVLIVGRELLVARHTVRTMQEAEDDDENRAAQAEAVQHWLLAALDESTDAIVVVDRIGREVVRNAVARRFAQARTGEVLAEEAVTDLLQRALDGHSSEQELQLYGPPRQVLQLRAFPLRRDAEVVGAVS